MAVPKVNLRQIQRKSGITYVLDYTVDGHRYRQAVGKNKRVAEQVAAKLQTDLIQGQFGLLPTKQASINLDDLASGYLKSKENVIRPASLNRYQGLLSTFNAYFHRYFPAATNDIRLIKGKYIKECFDYLLNVGLDGKTWHRKTLNLLRETTSAMFRYAIAQGYIDKNPVKETKKYPIADKGGVQYFTDDQLEKIWDTVDEFWVEPLKFIVNTGLRSGEMVNLRWIDVDLDGDRPNIKVTSSEEWETKTGKTRSIPLNSVALEIIERWQERDAKYVFISKQGQQINQRRPLGALQTALKKLGLKGDVHKLRHTFASNLVMKGVDLYTVKELLGHADLASTQIYAHLSQEHLKSAVDKLDQPAD